MADNSIPNKQSHNKNLIMFATLQSVFYVQPRLAHYLNRDLPLFDSTYANGAHTRRLSVLYFRFHFAPTLGEFYLSE